MSNHYKQIFIDTLKSIKVNQQSKRSTKFEQFCARLVDRKSYGDIAQAFGINSKFASRITRRNAEHIAMKIVDAIYEHNTADFGDACRTVEKTSRAKRVAK